MNLRDLQMSVDYATDQAHRAHTDPILRDEAIDERALDIALRIVRSADRMAVYMDQHYLTPYDIVIGPDSSYDDGGTAEQVMLRALAFASRERNGADYVFGWLDSIADRIAEQLAQRDDIRKQAAGELDAEEE